MLAENMVQIKMRLAEIMPNVDFYFYSSPIFMLIIGALAALLVGIFRAHPDKPNFTSLGIAIVSCVGGLIAPLLVKFNANSAFLGSGFLADGLSLFSIFIISAGTLFTLLLASGTNTGSRPRGVGTSGPPAGGRAARWCGRRSPPRRRG